jgi:pSer/pThr/pTyr-binding forkhead associated (FHA) protein
MRPDSDELTHTTPRAAYLIVIRQVFPLDDNRSSIGRSAENNLVIDDPSVSRAHVTIERTGEHYVIYDCGSSGGTYVNRKKISSLELNSGDIISIAGVKMLYVEDSPKPLDTSRLRYLHR